MSYDLSTPLDPDAFNAVTEVIQGFYEGGSSFDSPQLSQSEALHGLTLAEAADALNAHRLYEANNE